MSIFSILLGFGILAAFSGWFSGSDDGDDNELRENEGQDTDQPDLPESETPRTPPEDQDTGATLTTLADGTIDIDVGDDETGSLAVFVYTDTEDDPDNFVQTYEARFYLVPEGVDLPANSQEDSGQIPGNEDGTQTPYELGDLEAALGLELLGVVDLGTENQGYDAFDPNGLRAELPPITANAPLEVFAVEAQTDSDDVVLFVGETTVPTFEGAPRTTVAGDAVGTAATDWFYLPQGVSGGTLDGARGDDLLMTDADGAVLNGQAGDDALIAYADASSLSGGDGQDTLSAYGAGLQVAGGNGNDSFDIGGSGAVDGGPGNDSLSGNGGDVSATFSGFSMTFETTAETDAPLILDGADGDDFVTVSGATAEGYGGAGNDFIGVRNGATGYGQTGADTMQIDAGGTAFGGEGNDTLSVWEQHRTEEGTPVLSGGAGTDTFDLRVWNPYGNDPVPYTTITDFDPAEDILQVGVFQTSGASVSGLTLSEAPDGSYTDVVVGFANTSGLEPGLATIRLEGVTGLSQDSIVILT